MTTQGLNLFIVDDNKAMVAALKQYLEIRFGLSISVSVFYDGESCLDKIDDHTHIVILDYYMTGKNGLETLKSIKEINPKTEIIMLSGNEDIALAIESFRMGATDYIIKGPRSWGRLTKQVNKIITEPIRAMVREFGVPKFVALFFSTFVAIGVVVYYALRMM